MGAYTASVIGGTGLVGQALIMALIDDKECVGIHVLTRRSLPQTHPKIKIHFIDFDAPERYREAISGDVLFSCLGTTRRAAKSIRNHYLVDYQYQFNAAEAASFKKVANYVLVSSPWAALHSKNYYRKMKAELEQAITALPFEHVGIISPNGLQGQREVPRLGEAVAMRLFVHLSEAIPLLKKHQPIPATKVARLMIWMYKTNILRSQKMLRLQRDELHHISIPK